MPFRNICDSPKKLMCKKKLKYLLGWVLTQGGHQPPLDPTLRNYGAKRYAPICVPVQSENHPPMAFEG